MAAHVLPRSLGCWRCVVPGRIAIPRSVICGRQYQRRLFQSSGKSTKTPTDVAFAFDIDGVLLRSSEPLPGARQALSFLQQQQIPFILLTNGGGKSEEERVSQISKILDIPLDTSMFVQSHTPFVELVHGKTKRDPASESSDDFDQPALADQCVLVIGGQGEKCRHVAHSYGFKNVIIPADLIVAFPDLWPFAPTTDYTSLARPLPSNQLLSSVPAGSPDRPASASYSSSSPRSSASTTILDVPECSARTSLKIDAILIFNDPRDWALDTQLILDLLLSHRGYLGTLSPRNGDTALPKRGYQQDGQPPLYFSNPDFHWAAAWHLPRLGQGAFREALEGVWRAVTSEGGSREPVELQKRMIGKPHGATYEFAETRLVQHRRHLLNLSTDSQQKSDDGTAADGLRTVYMIGDNPESDILGANTFTSRRHISWQSILLRSGVYTGHQPPVHAPSTGLIAEGVWEAVQWALSRH